MMKDIADEKISEDEKKTLIDLGFLVEPEAESAEILGFMEEMSSINKLLDAVLVMNLDCNLACTYCFEGTRKGDYYMSRDTSDQIVTFLERAASSGAADFEEIRTVFYGGEPFLSIDMIYSIAERIKALSNNRSIRFNFSFITNGTMVKREVVERLNPLGLKSLVITLDGPEAVHDRYRPFRSGKGSFDTIIENIKEVCRMTDVQIGGNFTRENYREMPELLDYLLSEGLTPKEISSIRFDPVTQESSEFALPDFHEGCVSLYEPWLLEASVSLRGEILKRGFDTVRIKPSLCMMEVPNSMVINYDGSIYKCPVLIGREEFRAGHVSTGISDYRPSHHLDNWKNEECLDCCYLPLCFGGCRYMRLVREGSINGVDCKRPFYDAALESLVSQDLGLW